MQKKIVSAVMLIAALLVLLRGITHIGLSLIRGGPGSEMTVISLVLTISVAILFVRRPKKIRDPRTQKVRGLKIIAFGAPMVAVFLFIPFVLKSVYEGKALNALQHHGQRTVARVLDIYQDDCGKNGCSIKAKYQFSPEGDKQITGIAWLGNTRSSNNTMLDYAQKSHKIPVAYQVGYPQNSSENFNDKVFTSDHYKNALEFIKTIGNFLLMMVILIEVFVLYSLRKQSHESAT